MRANRIDRGEKIHAGEEKEEGGGEKEKEASVSRHGRESMPFFSHVCTLASQGAPRARHKRTLLRQAREAHARSSESRGHLDRKPR